MSVSIEGSRKSRGLEMCTSSEQHGKCLICYMENPKNWCDQKGKYKVHNFRSCKLYVELFSIKFFLRKVWERQKAMNSSLHVSSQTHKWHKHYLENLEALHLTPNLIYIIFHFNVLLHLIYYNSWVEWFLFMFLFCLFLFSQITSFISSRTLIMLYLFSSYLSVKRCLNIF